MTSLAAILLDDTLMVTRSDIERQLALMELLSRPDSPDLRRGARRTLAGCPERYALVPQLTAAFVQAKLLDLSERDVAG
jgi:hypothetical protein